MNHEEVYADNQITRRKISEMLSKDEIRALTQRSDIRGAFAIASTWATIGASFAALAWATLQPLWVSIPVYTAGIAVLGGRQLALAILTHEATHNTLFNNRRLNNLLTDWLCGRPIGLDLEKYRKHHFIHHAKTGTLEDTDISLVADLPTTRRSLIRKFLRDLTGMTGAKFLLGRVLMDAEVLKWTVASKVEKLPQNDRHWWDYLVAYVKNAGPTLITNAALFGALWAAGHPMLYLAWGVAYLIPYPFFIRVRALAEHAGTEMTPDMFKNTRTTRAGFLARTFVAPFNVNYHIEHHVLASVPYYRLPEMHRLLRERQMVEVPPGYLDVMKIVSSAGE